MLNTRFFRSQLADGGLNRFDAGLLLHEVESLYRLLDEVREETGAFWAPRATANQMRRFLVEDIRSMRREIDTLHRIIDGFRRTA